MKQSTLVMLSFLTPSLCMGLACDNASSPSQPWLRTPVEDAASTETLEQFLYVNYADLQEAHADTARRKRDFLYAVLWNYREARRKALGDPSNFLPNEGLPPWTSGKCNDDQKTEARQAIAWMAALLKVLADPRPYQDAGGQYSSYSVVGELISDQGGEYQAFLHYRDLVAQYLAEIKPIGNPGNNAQLWDYEAKDYDMVLLPLVGMLYGLRETKFYGS